MLFVQSQQWPDVASCPKMIRIGSITQISRELSDVFAANIHHTTHTDQAREGGFEVTQVHDATKPLSINDPFNGHDSVFCSCLFCTTPDVPLNSNKSLQRNNRNGGCCFRAAEKEEGQDATNYFRRPTNRYSPSWELFGCNSAMGRLSELATHRG